MEANRISKLFNIKPNRILNVYFTAGHPHPGDTVEIICELDRSGVDMIEVGMPYSDPLADGLTIQQSSAKALQSGMNLTLLFKLLKEARENTTIPLILMGYLNQVMQFGAEKFLKNTKDSGVDALIIPDLPMNIYQREFLSLFEKYKLGISFLITPQTSIERIYQADRLSNSFLYMVSRSGITGKKGNITQDQRIYFERIRDMGLKTPRLIGFGIHDKNGYDIACSYAHGAIIGSAFIRALENEGTINENIRTFITQILER